MISRLRWVVLVLLCAVGSSCELVGPEENEGPTSIEVSTASEFAARIADVRSVGLRVTRPGGTPRDTLFDVRVADRQLRARTILRPDESEPGTELKVTLRSSDVPLFSGSTVLRADSGWPFGMSLEVRPVVLLDLWGSEYWLNEGMDGFSRADITPLIYLDGQRSAADTLELWSSDPTIAEVVDGHVLGRRPGSATIVATFDGQVDSITARVFPWLDLFGAAPHYYAAPDDVILDTIPIDNRIASDEEVSVEVPSSFPWLSASLGGEEGAAFIELGIDATVAPPGESIGSVVMATEGLPADSLHVTLSREPTTGVEIREWNELCLFADSLYNVHAGYEDKAACVDLQARAWPEGDGSRVVIEARNLGGSLGDDQTDLVFDLENIWLDLGTSEDRDVTLLSAGPDGVVGQTGTPSFTPEPISRSIVLRGFPHGAITGCGGPVQNVGAYITCEPSGASGWVRFDLRVSGSVLSLADVRAAMGVRTAGFSAFCFEDGRFCHLR